MKRILKAPGKYIQGVGELNNLSTYIKQWCKKCMVIISEKGNKRFGKVIETTLKEQKIPFVIELFNGECCREEIDRLAKLGKENCFDTVIVVGGGKVLDTGRIVASDMDAFTVIVPTIASNDSPCSGLSVVYSSEGIPQGAVFAKHNPDIVLVDSQIIANAPSRMFSAGIGDALATYFEARASVAAHAETCAGGEATKTAFMMSRLCYDILMENAVDALEAVKKHQVTAAVEDVIEATVLLSGLGWESAGLCGAHPINDGLTYIPEVHGVLHGERVAIGTITQLVLENSPEDEINKIIDFCLKVDLPVCLADINVQNLDEAKLRRAAQGACEDVPFIHCLPFEVTADLVYHALLKVDEMGKVRKANR